MAKMTKAEKTKIRKAFGIEKVVGKGTMGSSTKKDAGKKDTT